MADTGSQLILDIINGKPAPEPDNTIQPAPLTRLPDYGPISKETRKAVRKQLKELDWTSRFNIKLLSPAQIMFLAAYMAPSSPTFLMQTESCYVAGVSYKAFQCWMKFDPFKDALETVKQFQLEQVEKLLFQKIVVDQDLKAIQYFLDRVGGDKWSPKAQFNHSSSGPVQIIINQPDGTQYFITPDASVPDQPIEPYKDTPEDFLDDDTANYD